ncbi:MAG: RNA-binding domain-containing protein [Candidatus Nanoarchaeia archaeon]|nr:RNA-binding domain-containing protein [Candidatus Nanoarchaeia archaeon]
MLSHNICISVFSKPEDDEENIKNSFISLFPFNLKDEKIELKSKKCLGFNEKKITVFEVSLEKEKHINKFLKSLNEKLSKEQKQLLINQIESRLDNDLNFFLRLNKEKLINEKRLWITDSGNCYHIKIKIAAFPNKKHIASKNIEKMFS